jgi:hypothetical protein
MGEIIERVGVQRRSAKAWISLISSALAVVGFCVALAVQGGPALVLGAIGAAFVVIAFTFRPRNARPVGAIYSGSADLLAPSGRKLPGQLSFTSTTMTWTPNRYSEAQGATGISASVEDDLAISLRRGAGLLDLIVTAGPRNGEKQQFLAHQSRRLRRAVDIVGKHS